MALLVNVATGNFNTAGTWNTATQLVAAHASTNVSVTGTHYSATFTAPNTTNANTGGLIAINGSGATSTSGTLTLTLQESDGATWTDKASASYTCPSSVMSPTPDGPWGFFWAGYTYTTTTANRYRYKLVRSGTFSTSPTVWAETTTSQFWCCSVDNRSSVPSTSDNVVIVGSADSTLTVTQDTSPTFGTYQGGGGSGNPSLRTFATNNALTLGHKGELSYSTSAGSYNMTVCGHIYAAKYGALTIGTTAAPYPATCTATLTIAQNGVATNFGFNTATTPNISLVGTPKSSTTTWFTTYSSGAGTTASPLITADAVDWAVNDEIIIGASSDGATNYLESETFFIKTKNSSTSYTLSATVGGAEIAGMTYSHTDAYIVNVGRNIIITSDSASYGWYGTNGSTIANAFTMEWVNLRYLGGPTAGRYGFYVENGATIQSNFNYNVIDQARGTYGIYMASSTATETFTGNVFARGQNAGSYMWNPSGAKNKTFLNWFWIDNYRATGNLAVPFCTMTNPRVIASNKTNSISYIAALNSTLNGLCTGMEVHCTPYGIQPQSVARCEIYDGYFGTKGVNRVHDIQTANDSAVDVCFFDCSFGSSALYSNYTNAADGNFVGFENFNQTQYYDFWYTNAGIFSRTGTGLTDTTVRTAGGYGIKAEIASTNTMSWNQVLPLGDIQNLTMTVSIFININSANFYAGTYTLPTLTVTYDGATTASSTATATTGWQRLAVTFTPLTKSAQALIKLSMVTDATGTDSYVYIDDMSAPYPAGYTLNLGKLDTWYGGKPLGPAIATNPSANDFWAVASTFSGTDTMGGYILNSMQKKIKYILDGEIPLT